MFCDLVGSTSLAAKLDAEDWRNLVNTYLDEAWHAVFAINWKWAAIVAARS
jgi:class 3 adenylate cyclase